MTKEAPLAHAPIEAPKGIAVFICGCDGRIGNVVDLDKLRDVAVADPNVRSVDVMQSCCGEDDMDRMRLALRSDEVDRFLVVGCSFRTMGERFNALAWESKLGGPMLELCNVLEQCAAVHHGKDAQGKAERLVLMSLARCAMLQTTKASKGPAKCQNVMVIGNGRSAILATRELLTLGHEVVLINPNDQFVRTGTGEDTIDPEEGSLDMLTRAFGQRMTISPSTRLIRLKGRPGQFLADIETPLGETALGCGAVILALDMEVGPNALAERFGGAIVQEELESRLRQGYRTKGALVMLAMDEKGESAFDPMSTHEAVHNALFVKGLSPKCDVYIITREVFALGQCEVGYQKAQASGVRVIRTDRLPTSVDGKICVRDIHIGQDIVLPADQIVLDNSMAVPDLVSFCTALGIPVDAEGRPSRPIAKLRPSASLREGVFLCGSGIERNLGIGPTLQAKAVAVRASALLRAPIQRSGEVAQSYPDKCSACLTCVRSCPYAAPYIDAEGKAAVEEDLCQGCGLCVSLCPSKALQLLSYRDDQIEAQIELALGGRP